MQLPTTDVPVDTVDNRWSQLERWLLPVLLLAAFALRVAKLEQNSLWIDEIAQVLISKGSVWQTILNSAKYTGSTPIDYVVTNLTLRYLGQSEGMLRLPDVIWGTLCVLLTYHVGRSLFNKPTGYLAVALLTIMPLHVQYSRELRFYILPTLLILLSIYVLTMAVAKNTWRWWVLYGLVSVLALYTHFYTVIVIGIQALWILLFKRQQRSVLIRFILAAGCAGLLFVPWMPYFFSHTVKVTFSWYSYPSITEVLSAPFFDPLPGGNAVLAANAGADALRSVYFDYIRTIVILITLYGSILILGLYIMLRKHAKPAFIANLSLLLMLTVGGVISSVIVSYVTGYFFAPRQVLFFTPSILLAVSAIFVHLVLQIGQKLVRPAKAGWFTGGAVLIFAAATLLIVWQPLTDLYKPYKQDWRKASRFLLQHMSNEDILLTPYPDYIGFYAPELLAQAPTVLPEDQAALNKIVQSHSHIWLIFVRSDLFVKPPQLMQWINDNHLTEIPLTNDFQVYRYPNDDRIFSRGEENP